jgi:hypothetical protein
MFSNAGGAESDIALRMVDVDEDGQGERGVAIDVAEAQQLPLQVVAGQLLAWSS